MQHSGAPPLAELLAARLLCGAEGAALPWQPGDPTRSTSPALLRSRDLSPPCCRLHLTLSVCLNARVVLLCAELLFPSLFSSGLGSRANRPHFAQKGS